MKDYNPYANGRWYKFFIESNGASSTITTSDILATISDNKLELPLGYSIMQTVFEIHSLESTNGTTYGGAGILANSQMYVSLPSKDNFDYMTVYAFCKTYPTGNGEEVKEEVKEVKKTRKSKE